MPTLTTEWIIMAIPSMVSTLLFFLVGIAGVIGAVHVATTRPDAFDAAGRQSKGIWTGILVVSALACLLRFPFICWFGAVAIGVYYFDVRPQIKAILNGNYGW